MIFKRPISLLRRYPHRIEVREPRMFRAVLSCVALLAAAASLVLSAQEVRAQQFIRLEGKDLATVLELGEENHAIGPVAKEVRAMMTTGGNTVITSIAFSPDSKTLTGGHRNHDILIYPVDSVLRAAR
jgi:hypothetical protein